LNTQHWDSGGETSSEVTPLRAMSWRYVGQSSADAVELTFAATITATAKTDAARLMDAAKKSLGDRGLDMDSASFTDTECCVYLIGRLV
jgi:hypothetical protein